MKRLLWLIVCLMTMVLTSCSTYYDIAETEYEVCYPDGTQKLNNLSTLVGRKKSNIVVKSYSIGGTNYLSAYNGKNTTHIITTTAPIRLNSYKTYKEKRKMTLTASTDGYLQITPKGKDSISMNDILNH